MTKNVPKLTSDSKPQIQEAQRTPSTISVPRTTPKHVILKLQKIRDKEKNSVTSQRKKSYLERNKDKNYI